MRFKEDIKIELDERSVIICPNFNGLLKKESDENFFRAANILQQRKIIIYLCARIFKFLM